MVKENTMKQTEIGLLPEDWEVETLREITYNIIDYRGVTPKKLGMDWGNGEIVALSAGNVKKGYIDFNADCYFGSEQLYTRWMRNGHSKKDDIVFTLEAPLGNVALIPDSKKYILSQRTILLQCDKIANPQFIFQIFLSDGFQKYISDRATGSTAQGIKRQVFETLSIPLPPLPEQEAIAEALSDADAWIESLEQLIAKKRLIKQGALQELLTPSADWEVKKLGEMTQLITKGTTPTSVGFDFTESGVNFIKVESLNKNGNIENDKIAFISERCNEVLSRSQIKEGDILFSIAGALGRVGIIKREIVPANTNQALGIIRLKENTINNHYLYYFFNKNDFQQMLNTISVTGAQPNLSLQNLNEFEIVFPSLTEQTRIATILSDMDAELEALEAQLGKAKKVKQGMMQELLTGRVRLV